MNILRVIANPKPTEQSASRKVEQAFTSALQAKYPDAKITTLDVYADEVPLLDDKLLPVFFGAKPTDDETARRRARQLEILELFLAADVVVIATPMWNFNAPPKLKAFMDTVMAAGKTFKYTSKGPWVWRRRRKLSFAAPAARCTREAPQAITLCTPCLKPSSGSWASRI